MTNVVQFPSTPEMAERKAIRDVTAFLAEHLAGAPKSAQEVRRAARHISRERAPFDAAKAALGIVHVESAGRGGWYWALPGDEHLVPYALWRREVR